jgi:hypothetical protein
MNKAKLYLKKLKNIRFGTIKAINAADNAIDEQLIFPAETFLMPAVKDIFGQPHNDFVNHKAAMPSFYVRCFNNAFCFTNREEVFSEKKDVIVEYTSQKTNPRIGESKKIFYRSKKRDVNATAAHLSLSGLENNYYHFLTECLARVYLLEQSKFKPGFYIISNHLPFQAELLELLGISADRIIPTNSNLLLCVKTLIVPDLVNNWSGIHYRGFEGYQKQWQPAWTVNLYRERISLLTSTRNERKKIYISRDKASYRNFEQPNEANSIFTQLGFETYYLEEMSITRQIELFATAGFIAGIHGAGFANLYFANAEAKVLEIFPEYYHDTSYRILSKTLGLSYSYLIGTTINSETIPPQKENLHIDINQLKQALVTFISE